MSTLYGREGGGVGRFGRGPRARSGADAARKAMSPKSWIRSGSLWFRFEYLPAREAFTPMRTERIKVVALARAKGAPRIAGASAPGNRSRRRAVWRVSGGTHRSLASRRKERRARRSKSFPLNKSNLRHQIGQDAYSTQVASTRGQQLALAAMCSARLARAKGDLRMLRGGHILSIVTLATCTE